MFVRYDENTGNNISVTEYVDFAEAIFKVHYENNTEKGTAKAIVEVNDEDMKGEIVSELEIMDVSEIYSGTSMDSWYFDELAAMQSMRIVIKSLNGERVLLIGQWQTE